MTELEGIKLTEKQSIDSTRLTKTQQRIVDAALDLISHVGYKSTTTKKIAEMAEVNETTIFKNFHSKQLLIDTAYKQHTHQITKEVDEFFGQTFRDPEDLLRKAGYFIANIYTRHRPIIIGSVKEVGNEKMKSISNYKQEYIRSSLSKKLREVTDQKGLADDEYDTLAYIFTNTILNLLIDQVREEYMEEEAVKTVNLDDIIAFMLKVF